MSTRKGGALVPGGAFIFNGEEGVSENTNGWQLCLVSGGVSNDIGGADSEGGVPAWRHPRKRATAAGGTHPTGMHSCNVNNF